MGVMPVNKLLVTMSLPIVISMLIQAMYNLVDSVFVAQINPDALTAVGMAFPMQSLMIAFQTGLGVGMNALVSRYLGQKKPYEAGLAATHALILTALNYVIFLIVGLTAIPAFFSIQTHSEIIAGYGVEYLRLARIILPDIRRAYIAGDGQDTAFDGVADTRCGYKHSA